MATWWESEGFDAQPRGREATGKEVLYRAYKGASRPIGKCFFRPKDPRKVLMISKFTAEDLEMELNVALWGNAIKEISVFRPVRGVMMFEGPVAQEPRIPGATAESKPEQWFSFVGAGEATLSQVWLAPPLDKKVVRIGTFAVSPGNFHYTPDPTLVSGASRSPRGWN